MEAEHVMVEEVVKVEQWEDVMLTEDRLDGLVVDILDIVLQLLDEIFKIGAEEDQLQFMMESLIIGQDIESDLIQLYTIIIHPYSIPEVVEEDVDM